VNGCIDRMVRLSWLSWFETRGIAALLTMRIYDLILRSIAKRCVSKDESPNWKRGFAS